MKKTDRDLLLWAAKAVGLSIDEGVMIKTGHLLATSKDAKQPFFWNPIDDDGDALRLMVKLGLGVSVPLGYKRTDVVAFSDSRINAIESHGSDPLAATRRAIVRAAAEIGRNMK